MGVQTYSLFNVAGLIDKDKNIYYVPQPELLYDSRGDLDEVVADSYYTLFKSVCPPSSSYTDKSISDWSPEDRRLVVEGTIDNFRLSRGGGLALNYCIVYRYVSSIASYTAFFITSVRQLGVNSVELMLEPDHFTNFFYLQNTEEITRDYDPFNPVMRNCYVERQHYDRVIKDSLGGLYPSRFEKIIINPEEGYKYKQQYRDMRIPLPIENINIDRWNEIVNLLNQAPDAELFCEAMEDLTKEERLAVVKSCIKFLNIQWKENIFIPTTYRRQNKSPYSIVGYKGGLSKNNTVVMPIIQTVYPFISIPESLSNIQPEWLHLRLKIEYNVTRQGYQHKFDFDDGYYTDINKLMQYLNNTGLSQYVLNLFVSDYSPLQKDISTRVLNTTTDIYFNLNIEQDNSIVSDLNMGSNIKSIVLNNTGIAFLPPIYDNLTNFKKESLTGLAITGDITISATTDNGVTGLWTTKIIGTAPNLNYVLSLADNLTIYKFAPEKEEYLQAGEHFDPIDLLDYLGFIIADNSLPTALLNINRKIEKDLTEEYFEPILESNPYSFYSISINQLEQPINKLRYVEVVGLAKNYYTVGLDYFISFNEVYKIGVVPLFTVENKEYRYYSEGLVTMITSQIPIIEDSWLTYYSQNRAQMKSQYAIQSNQFAEGMINNFVADTAGIAGKSGEGYLKTEKIKSGITAGLLLGGGRLVSDLVTQPISNAYAKKNITISQGAKEADMGAKPDSVKFAGTDLMYDILQNEMGFYLNHYTIDDKSYNSISKYLERFGYIVNREDELYVFNRVGMNYIKLATFDFVEDNIKIATEQANAISNIFVEGVTLLHDKAYLHNLGEIGYHNYEKILQGGDN